MIIFDDSDFQKKSEAFIKDVITNRRKKANHNVASEILRLSQSEVPHNIGTLQNSGRVEDQEEYSEVGYGGNAAPYAARLHEHPEYRFQKGRKGKYLEDPIKNNLRAFRKYFEMIFSQ